MTPETEERLQIARQATRILVEGYGSRIKRVVLYGSVARGKAGPDSDIDLCVVVPRWEDLKEGQLKQRLEERLEANNIPAGHRAGGVHLHLFDEPYLRQNDHGFMPGLDESTAGVIEGIRRGRVLYGG